MVIMACNASKLIDNSAARVVSRNVVITSTKRNETGIFWKKLGSAH